ncbi:MAG: hypothetical protein WBF87_17825 [Mesorhizobium sp.]
MAKTIQEEKAKQGRSGRRVLVVLVASLLLAAAVWFAVGAYGEFIETPQTLSN